MNIAPNGTAYALHGPAGAPVIALIHGIGLNSRIWDGIRETLTDCYRMLSYDLPGHGGSAPAREVLSLTVLAKQLRDLLDALEIRRCALAGFSIGGMINRRFAMDYPERVTALAILNSPHERDAATQKLVEERAARTATQGVTAGMETTFRRWFTPALLGAAGETGQQWPPRVLEIREWMRANDPESYAQARKVLATGVRELIRPHPPLSHPALVLTCAEDEGSTPAMSHAIAAEIAGAEIVIVPHFKHLGIIEAPQVFAAALRTFFDRVL